MIMRQGHDFNGGTYAMLSIGGRIPKEDIASIQNGERFQKDGGQVLLSYGQI